MHLQFNARINPHNEPFLQRAQHPPRPANHAILQRARFLPPRDAQLVSLALAGHTMRELAMAAGMSAGAACRRVRALMARLRDPVVSALIEHGHCLPQLHRNLGIGRLLLRRPLRRLERELDLTRHEAEAILAYLQGWAALVMAASVRGDVSARRRQEEDGDEE